MHQHMLAINHKQIFHGVNVPRCGKEYNSNRGVEKIRARNAMADVVQPDEAAASNDEQVR